MAMRVGPDHPRLHLSFVLSLCFIVFSFSLFYFFWGGMGGMRKGSSTRTVW